MMYRPLRLRIVEDHRSVFLPPKTQKVGGFDFHLLLFYRGLKSAAYWIAERDDGEQAIVTTKGLWWHRITVGGKTVSRRWDQREALAVAAKALAAAPERKTVPWEHPFS